ncbi:hypothetical protein TCEL_00857 [Thermobrachium celere DSM 8682]|uniref:Uncharacterized protein n=1 Tax=Thermobrachium celere DSM 8682 TaxID=941824 RepID=R7RUY1_9CLOT|nr:hypothetical protein TCEL_00857 [Thermobrachium celere DSM 8682]
MEETHINYDIIVLKKINKMLLVMHIISDIILLKENDFLIRRG